MQPMDDRKAISYSAIIVAAVAIAFTLREMRSVMVPFVIALFLFYIFSPVTDLLRRRLRVPHPAAVTLSLAGAIALLFGIIVMASNSIQAMVDNFDKYAKNVDTAIQVIGDILPGEADYSTWDEAWGQITNDSRTRETLVGAASSLPGVISNAAIVLVFFGYLISGRRSTTSPFLRKVALTINRYLVIKLAVSVATGSLVFFVLSLIGLRLAFIFGMLAFAFNFIPSVGSMIATMLPIPVAIAQFGLGLETWLVLLVPGSIQFVIGNVVEPMIQGEGLDLHPITVLLALMFWFTIWGVPGALIAAPLTSVIRIFLRQTDWGRPIANLLSGRI